MAFVPVVNSEIAADKPVTPALVQKFIDNVLGHDHSSGKGGTLASGSFEDGLIDASKVPDSQVTSQKSGLTYTLIRTAQEVTWGAFWNATGASYKIDPLMRLKFTPSRPTVYLIEFRVEIEQQSSSASGDLFLGVGFELNGDRQADTVVRQQVGRLSGRTCIVPSCYMLLVPEDLSEQIVEPFYESLSTVEDRNDLIVRERQFIMREWAA